MSKAGEEIASVLLLLAGGAALAYFIKKAPPTSTVGAIYMGEGAKDSDWKDNLNRSYAILKYIPGRGYEWGKVFLSTAFDARRRVMAPTLTQDGWLFAFMNGTWTRVVGK